MNYSKRKISVNFSIPLGVLERLDKECGGVGRRSAFITKLLKETFKMNNG